MNKTIIINIGNSIIHIEEEAYEVLTKYLNEIKQHFAKTADDFEIVKDIENRIAEMFAEILAKKQNQVIEMADVQDVIAQMGSVKDFSDESEEPEQTYHYEQFVGIKKLYRDTYEGVFAGVCSGLGHYFNIEARWIRLIFFLLAFAGGTGLLAYLILWIAMPRATTRSERMEMKGEATNLYGYKRSFEEELAAIKANMRSAGDQFRPLAQSSGNVITQMFRGIGKLIGAMGTLLGRIIAWFIVVFGFCALLGLIIALGALMGFWSDHIYSDFPFNIINSPFKGEFVLSAFVTAFVPLLALVLFAVKTINQRLQISKYVWFAMLVVWLIGAATVSFNVARIVSEFQEEAEIAQKTELKAFPSYTIAVNPNMVFSKKDSVDFNLKDYASGSNIVIDNFDEGPFRSPRNVRVEFDKSEDGKVSIMRSYKSNGKTFRNALENAQNMEYKYIIADSLITLNPRAILKEHAVWRDQNVVLTIKVPVGTKININDNLYRYLKFYYYCHGNDNEYNTYRTWIMTEEGLKCKYDVDHANDKEDNGDQ
ncbi:PspC domain-containing protein [Pedobacter sp.]|uniref:PspC domain-containing protein n=1 Tax=Pedobacter sp. TaxID=1411316 RepID=UPI00396C84DB